MSRKRIVKASIQDLYAHVTETSCKVPAVLKEAFRVSHLNRPDVMICIDSGLGGAFTLQYNGSERGVMEFVVMNPGFDDQIYKVSMI